MRTARLISKGKISKLAERSLKKAPKTALKLKGSLKEDKN